MLSKRYMALVLVLPLALGLVACGKSKKAASSSTGSGSANTMAVGIEAKDFEFSPTTLDVGAGQKITLTFKNTGAAEHNFSITSLNVNQDLAAGKTATVTFTAPSSAGDVQYFCEYHKDSKNMVGTLHVT
jgi:plastocyanin